MLAHSMQLRSVPAAGHTRLAARLMQPLARRRPARSALDVTQQPGGGDGGGSIGRPKSTSSGGDDGDDDGKQPALRKAASLWVRSQEILPRLGAAVVVVWGLVQGVPSVVAAVQGVATTAELHKVEQEIKQDIKEFKQEVKEEFKEFKQEVKEEFKEFKQEVKEEFKEVKASLKGLEVTVAMLASAGPQAGRGARR